MQNFMIIHCKGRRNDNTKSSWTSNFLQSFPMSIQLSLFLIQLLKINILVHGGYIFISPTSPKPRVYVCQSVCCSVLNCILDSWLWTNLYNFSDLKNSIKLLWGVMSDDAAGWLCRVRVLQMLKQQQQRELSELDSSRLAVVAQSEQLMAKYRETSERQKTVVSRCVMLHSCPILFEEICVQTCVIL